MRIVVTGAGGYLGRQLAYCLARDERFSGADVLLVDTVRPAGDTPVQATWLIGDLCDGSVRSAIAAGGVDIVFHLAGILGGAAETNYELARRVNVDATLSLFEVLRRPEHPPRVVFASTIAVFGPPMLAPVDDHTMPYPSMVYGAQKLMVETALGQFSRRGWIDGLALRLPGIVARKDADGRLKSAYLNRLFHDYAAGRPIVLPVSPASTSWLISAPCAVEALLHAASLPAQQLDHERCMTLPAQRVAMSELVAALARQFPDSDATVTYAPDADIQAQFGSLPPLSTAHADALGFRHDGNLDRLVERALSKNVLF